jgi:hypothetical protein
MQLWRGWRRTTPGTGRPSTDPPPGPCADKPEDEQDRRDALMVRMLQCAKPPDDTT